MSDSESHISCTNVTASGAPPKREKWYSRAVLEAIWSREKFTSVWAKDHLGFVADPHQAEFLNSEADSIVLLWSRQTGKTSTAAIKAAHHARWRKRAQTLIVSATQRQAGIVQRKVLGALEDVAKGRQWQVINQVDLPEDALDPDSRIVRCSVLSLELGNGSEVISVPASPDSIRGYSPTMILVDEASRVPDNVFDALRPMRAAHPCKLFLLSTPAGRRGAFYTIWESTDQDWVRSRVDATMCPRITASFLEKERLAMTSEAMFRQEYFNEFISLQGGIFTAEDLASIGAGRGAWKMPATAPRKEWEGDLVAPQKGWSL